jgi:hypothetical protein
MSFMRRAARYTPSERKRKEEIIRELHTLKITEFIKKYRRD